MMSMYRRGWFNESYRHSLAARGIPTSRYFAYRFNLRVLPGGKRREGEKPSWMFRGPAPVRDLEAEVIRQRLQRLRDTGVDTPERARYDQYRTFEVEMGDLAKERRERSDLLMELRGQVFRAGPSGGLLDPYPRLTDVDKAEAKRLFASAGYANVAESALTEHQKRLLLFEQTRNRMNDIDDRQRSLQLQMQTLVDAPASFDSRRDVEQILVGDRAQEVITFSQDPDAVEKGRKLFQKVMGGKLDIGQLDDEGKELLRNYGDLVKYNQETRKEGREIIRLATGRGPEGMIRTYGELDPESREIAKQFMVGNEDDPVVQQVALDYAVKMGFIGPDKLVKSIGGTGLGGIGLKEQARTLQRVAGVLTPPPVYNQQTKKWEYPMQFPMEEGKLHPETYGVPIQGKTATEVEKELRRAAGERQELGFEVPAEESKEAAEARNRRLGAVQAVRTREEEERAARPGIGVKEVEVVQVPKTTREKMPLVGEEEIEMIRLGMERQGYDRGAIEKQIARVREGTSMFGTYKSTPREQKRAEPATEQEREKAARLVKQRVVMEVPEKQLVPETYVEPSVEEQKKTRKELTGDISQVDWKDARKTLQYRYWI